MKHHFFKLHFGIYLVSSLSAYAGSADFAVRCAGSGVTLCNGFDTQADAPKNGTDIGMYAPYGTTNFTNIKIDSTQTLGPGASMSMTLPAGVAGSDSTGYFMSYFGPGRNFGQNSHFYVQYAVRISPEMTTTTTQWSAGAGNTTMWKFSIIHQKDASCSQIELTSVNYMWSTQLRPNLFPTMYTGCGASPLYTGWNKTLMMADGLWNPNIPLTDEGTLALEQSAFNTSGYNCYGGNQVGGLGDGKNCFNWRDHMNQWVTFYYDIQVGTWGQPNSTVKAYVAFNGGAYLQWINISNFRLDHNGSPATDGYNYITLAPYQTGLTVPANQSSTIWYDELIVSTQPISAPGGASVSLPLSAPKNLKVY